MVGITALSRGEIRIVQSSMVGSILSGTLLVKPPPVNPRVSSYH
jgi:Ca2+/H+ antiporter